MDDNIFSEVTSLNISTFWTVLAQKKAPYLGEVLFPNTRQGDKNVKFYRGLETAPVPLAPSAYDVPTIVRPRKGFDEVTTETHLYKEGKYVDESLTQQLLTVQNSNNNALKDIILNKIFDDQTSLIRDASLSRELMRMQLLQSGKFTVSGNGQKYIEDFVMKPTHKVTVDKAWSADGSVPADDIERGIDLIGSETNDTITRVVMNRHTFNTLVRNNTVKSTLLANNANTAAVQIPKSVVLSYLLDEFGINVQIYDKTYNNAEGKTVKFIPDGRLIMMPDGNLGSTVFSPTPEEIGLAIKPEADVTTVDTGVTISAVMKDDPVNKLVKVSQQVVPTFEKIDSIYVLDTDPKASSNDTTVTSDPAPKA